MKTPKSNKSKRITLKDIADMVGVSKVTVSRILRGEKHNEFVKISERTRQRVFEIANRYNYVPHYSARALATKRTGYIGFILSDQVEDGWANVYFSLEFAGVEKACRERGYGLNVSLYNLSNIDSFIFPKSVRQKSVDGLVLTGYVEAAIVYRFREFGIPCVCIGDNVEVAKLIPTVSADVVDGLHQAVKYAAYLGHRSILYSAGAKRREKEVAQLLVKRAESDPDTQLCKIIVVSSPRMEGDYTGGKLLFDYWMNLPDDDKPTLILTTDQSSLAFIKEMKKRDLRCPDDISIISVCDSSLCEYAEPALTAIHTDLITIGEYATNLLIDHLEEKTPLTPDMSRNDFPCQLIVRDSCMRVKEGKRKESLNGN